MKNSFNYSIIAVLLTSLVSTCLSARISLSVFGTMKRIDGFLSLFVYVFLFYMVLMNVKKVDVRLFVYGICGVAVLSSVYGLLQSYGVDPVIWLYGGKWTWNNDVRTHASSTFGNAAFFSAYLSMSIPLLIYATRCYSKWFGIGLVVVIYTMLVSGQRAAVVAMVVSLVYFAYICRQLWIQWVIACLISVVGLIIVFFPTCSLLERFMSSGFESRLVMGRVGWAIIKGNYWFGVGCDCLLSVYKHMHMVLEEKAYCKHQVSLHNQVLDILVSTGVFGLIAWIFLLLAYFSFVWYKRDNLLIVALSSSVVAYLINNQFSYSTMPLVLSFWVLMALTVVSGKPLVGEER